MDGQKDNPPKYDFSNLQQWLEDGHALPEIVDGGFCLVVLAYYCLGSAFTELMVVRLLLSWRQTFQGLLWS